MSAVTVKNYLVPTEGTLLCNGSGLLAQSKIQDQQGCWWVHEGDAEALKGYYEERLALTEGKYLVWLILQPYDPDYWGVHATADLRKTAGARNSISTSDLKPETISPIGA